MSISCSLSGRTSLEEVGSVPSVQLAAHYTLRVKTEVEVVLGAVNYTLMIVHKSLETGYKLSSFTYCRRSVFPFYTDLFLNDIGQAGLTVGFLLCKDQRKQIISPRRLPLSEPGSLFMNALQLIC